MSKRSYIYIFSLVFFFFCSCTTVPVISPELKGKVDSSLTFEQVLQSPNMYKGKFVLWGGEIIKILPQDGESYIEVLQKPIGGRGKPRILSTSEGEFLILVKEYLDLSLFKKGRKITVAGEIQGAIFGEKIKTVSEKDYRYPLLLSRQIHLWKEYFSPYSTLPPPRSPHDPYWYDPSERPLRF